MTEELLFGLSAVFALAAGTAAGTLSLLTWEILRQSPLGQAVFVLTVLLGVFTLYHSVVLSVSNLQMITDLVESTMYTGVAAFTWTMVWLQRRMHRRATKGVGTS